MGILFAKTISKSTCKVNFLTYTLYKNREGSLRTCMSKANYIKLNQNDRFCIFRSFDIAMCLWSFLLFFQRRFKLVASVKSCILRCILYTHIHEYAHILILNIFWVLIFYTFVLTCTQVDTTHNVYSIRKYKPAPSFMYTVKN